MRVKEGASPLYCIDKTAVIDFFERKELKADALSKKSPRSTEGYSSPNSFKSGIGNLHFWAELSRRQSPKRERFQRPRTHAICECPMFWSGMPGEEGGSIPLTNQKLLI